MQELAINSRSLAGVILLNYVMLDEVLVCVLNTYAWRELLD